MNVFAVIPTMISMLGYLPKALDALAFLHTAVLEVEATGQSGDQKLAAVLNGFEAFLAKDFPEFAKPFDTIAADVEAVVNDIVAIYNLFAKPAK